MIFNRFPDTTPMCPDLFYFKEYPLFHDSAKSTLFPPCFETDLLGWGGDVDGLYFFIDILTRN